MAERIEHVTVDDKDGDVLSLFLSTVADLIISNTRLVESAQKGNLYVTQNERSHQKAFNLYHTSLENYHQSSLILHY